MRAWLEKIAAAKQVILTSYVSAADRVHRAAITAGLSGVEHELKTLAYSILRELASGTGAKTHEAAS